ncbi:hypothetical protein Ctob_002046 [Chrysochromulina tobinii]|uniref:Uncharacterized protein n=1 Tax=Chrysochromulina tobinii TaxID=1460289 RepID=A0A0M0J8Q8_9EUKA|nr:hypothetical protein Ctob_002046 [Chrysochromulina tobinii]|eukprot:KOO22875.1 hypothetical protein Ctob_002046 [Chrysochromulina sp. CCMP291]
MLPLSDQTNAKDGHVLMMPVRLSYLTMATLLAHPPITAPFMTAANARAIVGGQVRNWDAQRGLFVLAFDNGSVEPAYLPQPSVKIVDARGTVLDWESFFNYCRSVGM